MEKHPKKAASISAELDLLRKAIELPGDISSDLRDQLLSALRSQTSFAEFEWQPLGIIASSLNTHKAVADKQLSGGYRLLDNYRKKALERLREQRRNQEKPNRGTIEWYQEQLRIKDDGIQQLKDDLVWMTAAIEGYEELAREMAQKAGAVDLFTSLQLSLVKKFPKDDIETKKNGRT